MKIAIMQPYFLPYIGYFQLIAAADIFVFYDDVNFIKQSWINRNRILINNKECLITLELKNASSFKRINATEIGNNLAKLYKSIYFSYKSAPYFLETSPLLENIFSSTESNLSKFNIYSIKKISEYLGINTKLIVSSELDKNCSAKGQNKVIEICTILSASTYINAIGGRGLYSHHDFNIAGIELKFLKSQEIQYNQFSREFIPWLSIIDILMFNSKNTILKMLQQYDLIN